MAAPFAPPVARAPTLIDVWGRSLQQKPATTFDPCAVATASDGCLATTTRSRHGGDGAARRAGACGRRRRGAEPGEAGGAGGLAAAPPARLPLREGLVLGLHPGRARRLLHRRGAGPGPRRAPQPPLQVRRPGRASPSLPVGVGHLPGELAPGRSKRPGEAALGAGGRREGIGKPGVVGRELPCALRDLARQHQILARVCVVLVLDSLNCMDWSLLPPATKEMVVQAEQLKGRFQGDPSFAYEYTEISAQDAERLFEDGKEVNRAKHLNSLCYSCTPHSGQVVAPPPFL